MGIAERKVVPNGKDWSALHMGWLLMIRQEMRRRSNPPWLRIPSQPERKHEVRVSVPGRETGNGTALGVSE